MSSIISALKTKCQHGPTEIIAVRGKISHGIINDGILQNMCKKRRKKWSAFTPLEIQK